ncbi:MAG: hypothetical protein WC008_00070 [Bacilli bacterium]
MKKIFSLILFFLVLFLSGCNTDKLELVEMTDEQKLSVLQEMDMPEFEGIKLNLNVDIQNTGEDAGEIFIKLNSYTNLAEDAEYLEYFEAEFDIDIDTIDISGKAMLFISAQYAYLETDAKSVTNSSTITYEGKEKMFIPETLNVGEEIRAMLDSFSLGDPNETPDAEELEEMAPLFDAMKVYQDDTKTKVELTLTKQILTDLFGMDNSLEQPTAKDVLSSGMSIAGSLLYSMNENTSIVITLNMNNSVVSDMFVSVNNFAIVDDEVNITGSISLKVEMNGSEPKVPTTASLESYEEVQIFTILEQFFFAGIEKNPIPIE